MATVQYEAGHKTLVKLCDAFGLSSRHVQRIVIDCQLQGVLTIHVQELPTAQQVDTAVGVLADVAAERRAWQAIKSDKPLTVTERAGVDIERRP